MLTFPKLSTNCIAQYPSTREISCQTRVLTYVDGTEQRFPQVASASIRWIVRLHRATERELAALEDFFINLRGSADKFAFTDPWDGTEHLNCSLDSDTVELRYVAHNVGASTLTIRTNAQ